MEEGTPGQDARLRTRFIGTIDGEHRMIVTRSGPLAAEGRVAVVGILNLTPDSFSDGGRYMDPEVAASRGEEMAADGADVLDLGGESTRPGSSAVPLDDELRRVLPALHRLRRQVKVPISVDTRKAAVARAAIDAGADIINDVSAGRFDSEMLRVAADAAVPMVFMHMQGTPVDMQRAPTYPEDDVVTAVVNFLQDRAAAAQRAGVAPHNIILDPGIGFGKTTAHNLRLIDRLEVVVRLGFPVLVGPSRKRFVGEITGGDPCNRLEGTAAVVALAVDRGAALVRVHDVRFMVSVVRMAEALRRRHEPLRPAPAAAAAKG